jgi:adenosylmethionine-8-amino-7-oxononanoate aminotransferase
MSIANNDEVLRELEGLLHDLQTCHGKIRALAAEPEPAGAKGVILVQGPRAVLDRFERLCSEMDEPYWRVLDEMLKCMGR